MTVLAARLLSPPTRDALQSDCVALIHRHIEQRKGIRGLAMRTGISLLKTLRADAVERGVEKLLPGFVSAIEPLHADFRKQADGDFSQFLQQHSDRAARNLLQVSDQTVAQSGQRTIQAAYAQLRRFARSELATVLPQVGQMIEAHLTQPPTEGFPG